MNSSNSHIIFMCALYSVLRTDEVKTKFLSCRFKCTCGCATFTDPQPFNLLMATRAGTHDAYLRPETAQGIFVSFDRVRRSSNLVMPFGIGQVGKAFRNEISPRDLLFRMREFEQLEVRDLARSKQPKTKNLWSIFDLMDAHVVKYHWTLHNPDFP